MRMHENELMVTAAMAEELIKRQFPQWAALPVVPVGAEGTVNAIFRLGEDLGARFPLLPGDAALTRQRLESEAAAARELHGRTRFPTPEPVAIGEPGAGYPLPWSVQSWVAGTTATPDGVADSDDFVFDLACFIDEVRAIPADGRVFRGEGRGGDLESHHEWMEVCFRRSGHLVDVERLRSIWERLRVLPRNAPDSMTHGDLVPGNVLVARGRLVGVLDVGGLGPADPALDLVSAWHLLDTDRRTLLRSTLGCDDLEWERGKAWALEQAMGAVWYYVESNPAMSLMGRRTLQRIVAAEPVS